MMKTYTFSALRKSALGLALVGAMLVTGCSGNDGYQSYAGNTVIQDPMEEVNRKIFAFNTAIDNAIIHPIVDGYRYVVPKFARKGIHNFLVNLSSPVSFMNQALQGDARGAGRVFERAAINTFIGLGGLIDMAAHEGITREQEDFGQTLGVWGVGHGPYLVVPVMGPVTTRDGIGFMVDGFADPLRMYLFNTNEEHLHYTRMGLNYLDLRNDLKDVLEDLQRSSIDYYAATRSIYYQRRDALVRDEDAGSASAATSGFDDF